MLSWIAYANLFTWTLKVISSNSTTGKWKIYINNVTNNMYECNNSTGKFPFFKNI